MAETDLLREGRRLEARVLRAEGLRYEDIGNLMGVAQTTACRWCDPAVAERQRGHTARWNREKRGRRNLAAIRGFAVKNRQACKACKRFSMGEYCRRCTQERRRVRVLLVQRFWSQGLTEKEISKRIGQPVGSVKNLVHAGRQAGLYLPYRKAQAKPERRSPSSKTGSVGCVGSKRGEA